MEALVEAVEPPAVPPAPIPRPALVRWLWQAAFWTGMALMVGGVSLVMAVHAEEIAARWLAWGWVLLTLGVVGVLLGGWLQRAHWLSVRVRQPDGPNIYIALPLPLGLVAWILRIARPFVPQFEETGVDELLLALREEMQRGHPFFVEVVDAGGVNESEGGEYVQVYFG